MAVNDLFTIQIRYLVDSRVLTSTYAYRSTFTEEPVPMTRSLARAFNEDIMPEMMDVWSDEVQFLSSYSLGVVPAGRIPNEDYFQADFGDIVGEPYPNNRPYVLQQVTDSPNSKHNGRIYMSGFAKSNVTAQVLNLAFMSGPLAALVLKLQATIADPDELTRIWQPVVLVRSVLGVPQIPPTYNDVVNVISTSTIFSQRRRITRRTNIGA